MTTGNIRTIPTFLTAAALATAALAAPPTALGQSQMVQAFAALPAMQSPALSADGRKLAFITHEPERSLVVVVDLDSMAITHGVDTAEAKPRSVTWASDDALVFTAGIATNPSFMAGMLEQTSPYGVDLSTEQAQVRRLLLDRGGRGAGVGIIGGLIAIDGAQLIGYDRRDGRVLFPKYDTAAADRVLYSVDPKTDQRRVVDRGARDTRDWVVSETGEPLFRIDYTQSSNLFLLLGRERGRWEVIVEQFIEIPELNIFGLDADDRLVVGTRPAATGRFGLYTLSTDTGELGEAVLTHDRYDVTGVRTDPYTNRVIGAALPEVGAVWFDDELAEHQRLLDQTFEDEVPVIVSWSEDRDRFLVVAEGSSKVPGTYLYDSSEPSIGLIASAYSALQNVQLPSRDPYRYEARDGTAIPGYLTRPVGADGATPLVVLPHGGPAAMEVGGFDWLAHYLAARGYTVLQPNFRGSGGMGQAWEQAGHGEWGIGVMQHDLTDGVAALVDQGLADPERVCIVGASYGGYAALAGAVFTPELYRCAAAIAGVSDLVDMLGFESGRQGGLSTTVSYWRRAMGGGDPDSLNDRLRAASPAEHADRARAPILLVHGLDDAVVPVGQSRTMQRALEAAGREVELVELDGEDHWLSGHATRAATLDALDRFLAEHLAD